MRVRTSRGYVTIQHRCPAGNLARLKMAPGLGIFFHSHTDQQQEALVKIADMPDGWVTVARRGNLLVGYVTFHPPSPYVRWGKWPGHELLELGGIEVDRDWRGNGIAHRLLQVALADPVVEDLIIISTGMHWYWDTEGTGLTTSDYRAMLATIFSRHGFARYRTDEPNVVSYMGDVLVARIGARVPAGRVEAFRASLFEDDQAPPAGEPLEELVEAGGPRAI
jgi:acetoin utilization protein AcuA